MIAVGVVSALLITLIAIEVWHPARRFDAVAGWRARCLWFLPPLVLIASVVPWAIEQLLAGAAVFPGARLGTAVGTVVGIVASELLVYWAHRLHHRVPVLWRWIHQLHHSAERMDVFGALYFHPLEILEGSIVGACLFVGVLGLTPEAASLATLWQVFNGIFQHGNIRTPRWLGYLIQRPEQHGIHHQRGIHGYNYANLPLWDIVFGTFRNPLTWNGVAGFYAGASNRTLEMLLGKDISGSDATAGASRSH